jgi:micrococcal nuclease
MQKTSRRFSVIISSIAAFVFCIAAFLVKTPNPGPASQKTTEDTGKSRQLGTITPEGTYLVSQVVDGDTVRVINSDNQKLTLRIIGINTPETVAPNQPIECFGPEASNRAKELLLNQRVQLEFDPSQAKLDKYGRTLAYVRINDRDFGEVMLSEGLAREYTYNKPYAKVSTYTTAQKLAQKNKVGLWGECSSEL